MSLTNIKRHVQAVRQNDGILQTNQIEIVAQSAEPSDSDLALGRIYVDSDTSIPYFYNGSAFVSMIATASGTTGTLDDALIS